MASFRLSALTIGGAFELLGFRVVLRHAMLRHAMLRHAMLRHAMPCCAVPCFAIPSYGFCWLYALTGVVGALTVLRASRTSVLAIMRCRAIPCLTLPCLVVGRLPLGSPFLPIANAIGFSAP